MTEEYLKRKRAYILKYQKDTYTNVNFKLRVKEDKDIIDKLNSVPNKSEYIKRLIRNDK